MRGTKTTETCICVFGTSWVKKGRSNHIPVWIDKIQFGFNVVKCLDPKLDCEELKVGTHKNPNWIGKIRVGSNVVKLGSKLDCE